MLPENNNPFRTISIYTIIAYLAYIYIYFFLGYYVINKHSVLFSSPFTHLLVSTLLVCSFTEWHNNTIIDHYIFFTGQEYHHVRYFFRAPFTEFPNRFFGMSWRSETGTSKMHSCVKTPNAHSGNTPVKV